ncbi:MAG: phospholipase D family protein [Ardenticatenaceae bacterium]|nr:phospholipase D family protein [Ardenticatenaceae bacterium]
MSEIRVSVAVTGIAWMGSGTGSIESALERLFREAEQEIGLTAYTVSSGADLLFDWLEAALARGVQVRLVVNRLDSQPADVATRLKRLATTYSHFHLYDFRCESEADLHAKAIIADRRLALVGSSNLSRRGLLANHELAVLIEGPAAADVARAMDRLFASRYVMSIGSGRFPEPATGDQSAP